MGADRFLEEDGVKSERDAMQKTLEGALQRNKTYKDGVGEPKRKQFREKVAELIRCGAQPYIQSSEPIADAEHCAAIQIIVDELSGEFGACLTGDRLRFGTAQKGFNLYLKYLWRMGKTSVPPPHCPIDSIVLNEGKIKGTWTKCDSAEQYMNWIMQLRTIAHSRSLAEWEYRCWEKPTSRKRTL
jgi:hypothetical protein